MLLNENEIPYRYEIEAFLNLSDEEQENFLIRLAGAASEESLNGFYWEPSGDANLKKYEVFIQFIDRLPFLGKQSI